MQKYLPVFFLAPFICTAAIADATDTSCASGAFANALAATADTVSETDDETTIREWIYTTFSAPDVLRAVLACPEIAGTADDDTIKFIPIEYNFPGGRRVVVNYETQPKILKQRLTIGNKRTVTDLIPNPRIGGSNDNSVWTNTDPAWYAIMVVQSGALSEFAGANKNNTISLRYIADNIDKLYPGGYSCTSKSALANDNDAINRAAHNTVNIKDDTNDYYVAGDVNLQWISYAEVALDVVITVVTMGGGTVILGATKAARASRVLKNLTTTLRSLARLDSVRDYIRTGQQLSRAQAELRTIDRAADAARYADKMAEVNRLTDTMRNLERTDDNVKQYKQAAETYKQLNQYRRALRGMKIAQRGNVVARAYRATKAAMTGNKLINRGAKIARASTRSGRIRDWLFNSTLRNAGTLAKMEAAGGLVYGILKFAGDMYDWTETSTGEFTSGVEFSPLLLLSADDLAGQENVINHGMWLMWAGDATNVADDDAAYLQALDFAEKFHQDLSEIQDDTNAPCDIDIYVVRPVIRNPGTETAELYYLIMNDEPWSTADTTTR